MKRTTIKELYASPGAFDGKAITVAGWIKTMRSSNAFGFIELGDGSTFPKLQIVLEAEKLANYTEITKQNVGAAIVARGTLVLTPEAKQPFELKAESIEVEGASTPDFPLQKKKNVFGVSAHGPPSQSEDQHLSGGIPRPLGGGVCHS